MDTKLYLTIAAIIALLYTFAFLLIPEGMSMAFSGFVEPHATLNLRFLGGANLAWGLILWFARDWDRHAVRGVLICSVACLIVIAIVEVLSARRLRAIRWKLKWAISPAKSVEESAFPGLKLWEGAVIYDGGSTT